MAVVRNITSDARSVGSPDAPPAAVGDEVTISDANFVDRAWPRSTWELVKKPGKGYVDASPEDAHLFITPPEETLSALRRQATEQGIDLTGHTTKAEIAAAIAKGPTTSEESAS